MSDKRYNYSYSHHVPPPHARYSVRCTSAGRMVTSIHSKNNTRKIINTSFFPDIAACYTYHVVLWRKSLTKKTWQRSNYRLLQPVIIGKLSLMTSAHNVNCI